MTREALRRLARAFALMARALESEAEAMPRATLAGRSSTLTPKRRAQLRQQGQLAPAIKLARRLGQAV